ncbi:MAG: hypothetical protein JNM83_22590 [Myxococcales bacterium]|nr:hypothetical protein [Myxococcales bacterium]
MARRDRKTSWASAARTHQIIADLFAHPPVSHADLMQRIEVASVGDARHYLLDRMQKGKVEPTDVELYGDLFHVLGLGGEAEALVGLVKDPAVTLRTRSCAMGILLSEDPGFAPRLQELLSPEEMLQIIAQPLADALIRIEADPAEGEGLVSMLSTIPPDMMLLLFEELDRWRIGAGLAASVAYEALLRSPLLGAVFPKIVESLREQGDEEAVALLESVRAEVKERTQQRLLQGALLRLRTRLLDEPKPKPSEAVGFLSGCDTLGCFVVVAQRQNPDGTATLAVLCLHVSGEVRSGYVLTGQPPDRAKQLCTEIATESGTRFIETKLGRLTTLLGQAAQKTLKSGRSVPVEAMAALRFVSPFVGEPLTLPEPSGRLTLTALRALLSRPEFGDGWRFTQSELDRVPPPKLTPRTRRTAATEPAGVTGTTTPKVVPWWQMMAAALAKSDATAQRLRSMISHMAHYYVLAEEPELAKLCLLAAAEVERDFVKSRLTQLLAENTLAWLGELADSALPPPRGRTGLPLVSADRLSWRQQLKSRFFAGIEKPSAHDLLALDYADEALQTIVATLSCAPSEEWPRFELQQQTAFELAVAFRDQLIRQRGPSLSRLLTQSSRLVEQTMRVSRSLAGLLSSAVLTRLAGFAQEVCSACKVDCLNRIHADVSREFFALDHPGRK